ncbi:MAG: hypothetical protein RLZ10_1856 [Bacteroidota bacterium]|jgi:Leucine-rich repeat (LRR) protein
MKITSLLSKLIVENSRFQVLYDKMVKAPEKKTEGGKPAKGLMDFDILKRIIMADPTSKAPENFDLDGANVQDMEKVKVGNYTQWLLKNFVKPTLGADHPLTTLDPKSPQYKTARKEFERLFLEDLYKQTERLEFYTKAKQYLPLEKRDIGKLSIADLFDIFSNFQLPEKKRIETEKKEAKKSREGFSHKGSEILYQGADWTLIKISDPGPAGKDAAIWYGGYKDHRNGETDWCTSSPGLNWFDRYISKGPLYVVFPNDDKGEVGKRTGLPKERYQFHFQDAQFMDRDDHQINLVDFLNKKAPELKPLFKHEFAKGLTTKGGTKVEIIYPESSAGKFVALYGFEDLFKSLPKDIKTLNIINKSKENIALDVPNEISQFKDLHTILLQNMVKTVPESIGNLPNLAFISLPDNKDLESIPESIKNLKNLTMLNLKNSNPNVKIPESLKDILEDNGAGFYSVL